MGQKYYPQEPLLKTSPFFHVFLDATPESPAPIRSASPMLHWCLQTRSPLEVVCWLCACQSRWIYQISTQGSQTFCFLEPEERAYLPK